MEPLAFFLVVFSRLLPGLEGSLEGLTGRLRATPVSSTPPRTCRPGATRAPQSPAGPPVHPVDRHAKPPSPRWSEDDDVPECFPSRDVKSRSMQTHPPAILIVC